MNKYLRFFIDAVIKLAVAFVGLLFSLNVFALGFIGFPELVTRVNEMLPSNPSWFEYYFVPGALPLFFLLAVFTLSGFLTYKTIRLIKRTDIEGIISAVKKG